MSKSNVSGKNYFPKLAFNFYFHFAIYAKDKIVIQIELDIYRLPNITLHQIENRFHIPATVYLRKHYAETIDAIHFRRIRAYIELLKPYGNCSPAQWQIPCAQRIR